MKDKNFTRIKNFWKEITQILKRPKVIPKKYFNQQSLFDLNTQKLCSSDSIDDSSKPTIDVLSEYISPSGDTNLYRFIADTIETTFRINPDALRFQVFNDSIEIPIVRILANFIYDQKLNAPDNTELRLTPNKDFIENLFSVIYITIFEGKSELTLFEVGDITDKLEEESDSNEFQRNILDKGVETLFCITMTPKLRDILKKLNIYNESTYPMNKKPFNLNAKRKVFTFFFIAFQNLEIKNQSSMKIKDIPFSLQDFTNGIQYFIPSLTLYLLKIYKTVENECPELLSDLDIKSNTFSQLGGKLERIYFECKSKKINTESFENLQTSFSDIFKEYLLIKGVPYHKELIDENLKPILEILINDTRPENIIKALEEAFRYTDKKYIYDLLEQDISTFVEPEVIFSTEWNDETKNQKLIQEFACKENSILNKIVNGVSGTIALSLVSDLGNSFWAEHQF